MKTTIQCVAKTLITLVVCTFITASISQPAFAIEEPNEILIGDVEVTYVRLLMQKTPEIIKKYPLIFLNN